MIILSSQKGVGAKAPIPPFTIVLLVTVRLSFGHYRR